MYDSQYVILLFLLTEAGAEWFNKTESDATVSFFISTYDDLDTRYSYPEAREFCKSQGGTIASVLSKEEEDIFLWRLHTTIDGYYIGLKVHYKTVDSTPGFSWVDGSPYNYSNWDASENFNNLCTAYIYNNTSKAWNWKTSICIHNLHATICKRNFSAIVITTPTVLDRSTIPLQESTEVQVTTEAEHYTISNAQDIFRTSYSYPIGTSNTEVNTDISSESVSGNAIRQANTLWTSIGASLGIGVVIIIIIIVILVVVLRRKQNNDTSDKGNNHDEIESTIYDNNSIPMTNIQFNNNGFGKNIHINVNAQTLNQTRGQNNQDVITNENENDNVYTDNSTKDNSKTPTQEELEEMYAQVNKSDTNINGNMQMLGNVTCDITKSDIHSGGVTDKPSQVELEDMYAQVNKPIAAVKPSMSGIKAGYDNHGSNMGTLVPGQHAITALGLSDEPDGEVEFSDNLIYSS